MLLNESSSRPHFDATPLAVEAFAEGGKRVARQVSARKPVFFSARWQAVQSLTLFISALDL